MNNTNLEVICEQIRKDIDLDNAFLSDSYFYSSLSLCVIDAVFSIGVRYSSVKNTVANYADYFGLKMHRSREENSYPSSLEQNSLKTLISEIDQLTVEKFTERVFKNRQRTSTRSGILKTEAVYQFASVLLCNEVNTFDDIKHLYSNAETIGRDIRKITGQKSGISYDYFLMLAGNDNLIKPDRMINRYFNKLTDETLTQNSLLDILTGCSSILKESHPTLSPRILDHEIWKFQRTMNTTEVQ